MSLSCFDLGERMLSVDEALSALQDFVPGPLAMETLPLSSLLDRVLAEDVTSTIDVPQRTNAAMDGIALAWTERLSDHAMWRLAGHVLAGYQHDRPVVAGEAVAITTGAPMPAGTDTVIMNEQLDESRDGDGVVWMSVSQPETVKRGQHVRQAGEDIGRGDLAFTAGTRIKPQHLGFLASLGVAEASVYRRPQVTIFSTGDEVNSPGEPLPEAGIYDANRFSLLGLLTRLGCDVDDAGILPDRRDAIRATLQEAAARSDAVITSGGVSVGQADWIKAALNDFGELGFWRIALRPGRPLAFGLLGEQRVPFFGLPGNPVAVMVTFLQFVQPALRRLQGEFHWAPRRLTASAESSLRSRRGRVDYVRGIYRSDDEGRLWVRSTGQQGSGILSSMVSANCLIEISAELESIAAGDRVLVQPFHELL
ncbi:molybdopterin molybdotransferase MoeA [Aidingimonas lacisalsi]|uniref:molybdopterin molybdotransferase MoeA n=1 Tax=Aidingimonas lacisalsi TaxID=2604086 RepID=UPI0011D276E7|nr:gephyrin-like molybdotransferase Glp [Aidingimonas lacisalsi]